MTILSIVDRERARALRLLRAAVSARAAAAAVAVLSLGALALGGSRWIVLPRLVPLDRKSTRLNSSHSQQSRMPSSA